MISKYNSFLEDRLLESIINESFLYLSPTVRKVLGRVFTQNHSDIASDILSSEGTDVKPDMTFIDLGKEGYLSFITMKNAKPLVVAKYPNMDWATDMENKPFPDPKLYSNDLHDFDITTPGNDATGVFTKSRNEVGIGRFVNKLFPGKYNSQQIEKFINQFKATLEKSGEYFDEVIGDDIEKWYNYENYKEVSGTLGNSCMAKKRGLFGIYTQNQDVCKMLILLEDDKLIGRALVWKLNSVRTGRKDFEGAPEYFMDRQYTIKDSDVQKFRNYAISKGWAYKSYNNHHSFGTVNINGEDRNVQMTVKVKDKDYSRYPYMDTFRRYDVSNGILHNDDEQDKDYEGQYILEDTGGGYNEIEGGVYSEWYDRRIDEDDAVWSDALDDYLIRDRAVEVRRGYGRRRGWWPEDHDDIFYDEDNEEYFHTDDAVYSGIENRYMFSETAVLVVNEIYNDGDVPGPDDQYMYEGSDQVIDIDTRSFWYDKITDKFSDWSNYNYIDKDLLVKNYRDEFIPKKFATEVYKIDEPKDNAVDITGVEYLTKLDAEALGYTVMEESVDGDEKRVIDWFTYTESISEFLEILTDRISKLFDKYDDIINDKGQLRIPFKDMDEQEYKDKIRILRAKCEDRKEDLDNETWN